MEILRDYPSQSEADLALCGDLAFWTGPDPERIDRLFRQSKLFRPKWDESHYAGGRTYGEGTIAAALRGRTAYYGQRPTHEPSAHPSSNPEFLNLAGSDKPGTSPESGSRFRFLSVDDYMERPDPDWRIFGVLPTDALGGIVGEAASFKSFVTLDMALSVSVGKPWAGHKTKLAPVAYIAAEGGNGLKFRIKAWQRHWNIEHTPNFFVLPEAAQLIDQGDVTALVQALAELPAKPGLIVVDTLARTMVGGDENSARDMSKYIAGLDRLRTETGATLLVVHHVTKSTGGVTPVWWTASD